MLRSVNKRKGVRYVHMELEYAARNVYLQAASLGLGTVVVGTFDDDEGERLFQMEDDERTVCIMPLGRG